MRHNTLAGLLFLAAFFLAAICQAVHCAAANWQYAVPFEPAHAGRGGQPQEARALMWLPPQSKSIRGVLVGGQLGIELEIALDAEVRKACAENDLGIVYFTPHLSGVFHFWQEGSTDTERFLKAMSDLGRRSGHPELARVPWITMGHSTAGIFCRNVAYWRPDRVAGILHIKSGNFHQKDHLPPSGSLAGIPLLAINGQFETFGPEGGLRPEYGRETQWVFVRQDIQRFRSDDPNYRMSIWLDLGGDHFHGSPELCAYAAMFIRKTAQYRIPRELPAGDDAVKCLPLARQDGWLTDADLYAPKHPPAACADYRGPTAVALWHYDAELARANAEHHRKLGHHQVLGKPALAWLDEGDGWSLRAQSELLDTMPDEYGGNVGGKPVGHAATPPVYRSKSTEPVVQLSADTFRLLRPVKMVNIAAVHPGDEPFRATNRWSSLKPPSIRGGPQTIDFPAVPDLKADAGPCQLRATSSADLPVYYEVDYGPVVVKEGKLLVSDVPAGAVLPMECRVTAHQIGRRIEPTVAPAPAVTRVFQILKP